MVTILCPVLQINTQKFRKIKQHDHVTQEDKIVTR